ncbi:Pantothenate transporter liz1 [Colletotrichum gloeosporioides]|uniref:Pantothenate transporter liz1 n=1 Tax=Colletotrichum gloeosporioides TaxID=474922 RepID=A0A8H4CQJ9_COLGL|nr:Pantothenate transporter liz1 [Colletotrichum gloeosporioides]KAF3808301.1 Pantothenate transporter liz1 [Colletotrichum gloeosporioides]
MFVFPKLREIVWGRPAATSAERRLIVKLDIVILSFCCLMYWVNYLDRMNLNNAYVSGMREDLDFHGNQLNVINTIFYGGYVLGQIPNNLALQKLPPRLYFPACMIAWGLLTLGTGLVHHPWQIMILRFFQAVFESSTFVGCHYILGSWYREDELGKRTAIFTSSGLAGTMFSGFLQGGIHKSLDGVRGLPGWRWLFIIDFCITLPVALYGFIAFPDTPTSTRAWWLTDEEKRLAVDRLPEVKKSRGTLGWSLVSRILKTWHWLGFVFLWIFASNTEMFSTNAIMNLWLSSTGNYSVEQVNYIPTGVAGVGIAATLLLGWYSDFTKRYWHVGIILSSTAIVSGAIMLQPPTRGAKFFALFLNGCQYASQTVLFAWANAVTREDDAKRAVILAAMNTFAIAVYMFWSLIFYSATQGPDWMEGSIAMMCMGASLFVTTLGVWYLTRRESKTLEVVEASPASIISTEEKAIDGVAGDMKALGK